MKINKEIKVIRELFNLTQSEFAEILGVSVDSIIRWEQNTVEIEERNIELIYNFAYNKGINFNKIYEQILLEEYEKTNIKLLFHGAKNTINMPVDLKYSKENNDFGRGFYLGENFEQACEKMMESINYRVSDLTKDAYKLLKKLVIREKLELLIGKDVNVYIDRPKGSIHPKYPETIYPINYGYIKEIISADDEYQDVYILGEDSSIDYCAGKVYAVVEREDDVEDKLIVSTNDKEYSNEEIKKIISFQEKYFKYKIIR